jgi:hypothetical protein
VWNFDETGGTMQDAKHDNAPITTEQLAAILERLTVAQTVTDVSIAAGIALNELRGVDD